MRSGFAPDTHLQGLWSAGAAADSAAASALAHPHPADDDGDGDDALHASGRRLRTVFISDLHLGTAGCQAKALLAFLKAHPSEKLYLVGDIIDGWQLRRKWYWPQSHNDVVQKILRRARKGCKVIYVPGNHDELARHFIGHQFGGVKVVEDAIHQTADGKKLWVIHGDHFDGVICGHIHHAEIRDIDGTLYCNDGDWVESLTALVEHHDGRLEIWPQRSGQRTAPEAQTQAVPEKLSA